MAEPLYQISGLSQDNCLTDSLTLIFIEHHEGVVAIGHFNEADEGVA